MAPNPYRVEITRDAVKELARLPKKVQDQAGRTIRRLLERYSAGERPQDIRPIESVPGSYGIDSGEYRILYAVDGPGACITVWRIGNRKDVYRNL